MEERVSIDSQPATLNRVYTFGHALLSQDQLLNGTWTVSYHCMDGHGNTRFLTSQLGDITDTYDYDAFGNLIALTGSTPNNFLFTTEQFDPDLGLYFLRARYQDTTTGRFWTVDGFEGFNTDPESLHKYVYVKNNPTEFTDPSGRIVFQSINSLLFSAYVRSIYALPGFYFAIRTLGAMRLNAIIGLFRQAQAASALYTMRVQQLMQSAAQQYPACTIWHDHHLLPQWIVRLWQAGGVQVPRHISEAMVRMPHSYHVVIHNNINAALRGIDVTDPANFFRVVNAIQQVYWQTPPP